MANTKISRFDRMYVDGGGIDVIGRSKLWYGITVGLILLSFVVVGVRGFNLSLEFVGGTKINMPAAELVTEQVGETFTAATGVHPQNVQIVGSGSSATLEINSERLSDDQISAARAAIYEKYQPLNARGEASPDAIGSSTVSESWGSAITKRMLLAMFVFLIAATVYVAVRLQRNMAFAALVALIVDAIVIGGFYALFGFEVSPAVIIGMLTTLTFSIYDTVIVFDKVNENTEGLAGQRQRTYAEQANLAINQTFMRSFSTTVISALPIISLLVVAVWLLGIGTLRDLALIQLVGVVEGIFSSLFLAAPLLVTFAQRRKDVRAHNEVVASYRAGTDAGTDAVEAAAVPAESAAPASAGDEVAPSATRNTSAGATWRPGR